MAIACDRVRRVCGCELLGSFWDKSGELITRAPNTRSRIADFHPRDGIRNEDIRDVREVQDIGRRIRMGRRASERSCKQDDNRLAKIAKKGNQIALLPGRPSKQPRREKMRKMKKEKRKRTIRYTSRAISDLREISGLLSDLSPESNRIAHLFPMQIKRYGNANCM